MINNCKFLYLSKCKRVEGDWLSFSCFYMNDPQSCPQYEEPFNKPYHTPSSAESTRVEDNGTCNC